MHNNDLSKDDFLEAFMAVMDSIKDWIKKKIKETKESNIENDLGLVSGQTNEQKLEKFKEIIQYIRGKDLGEDVNRVLDFMEKNPEESFNLITNAFKNEIASKVSHLENAKDELNKIDLSKNTLINENNKEQLEEVRESVNQRIKETINAQKIEQDNENLLHNNIGPNTTGERDKEKGKELVNEKEHVRDNVLVREEITIGLER